MSIKKICSVLAVVLLLAPLNFVSNTSTPILPELSVVKAGGAGGGGGGGSRTTSSQRSTASRTNAVTRSVMGSTRMNGRNYNVAQYSNQIGPSLSPAANTLGGGSGGGRGGNRSNGGGPSGPSGPACTISACTSAANYCGMQGTGTQSSCTSICSAVAQPDTACTNLPLDPNTALTANPAIVRTGSDTTLTWDLGTNYPPACTLTGQGLPATFSFAPGDRTGTRVVTVTGPHRYTLSCGSSSVDLDIRVLPVLYES